MNATAPDDAMIRLDNVAKEYPDGTVAVHDLTLHVRDGETCVLVGASGCGKTTAMRMINRLVEPTRGTVMVDGVDVMSVDFHQLRRRIGYVIQQVGLFPHWTVRRNVATVCDMLGWDKKRVADRVDELLDMVGLPPEEFGKRYPHQLSGGQRQRVGVARALAFDPPVLIMDEPFGAVDPIARDHLQEAFIDLQKRVRKTVVIVTHDIDEAVRLGDRIAVLRTGGYLDQYATPAEVLGNPATPFVAEFTGTDRTLKLLAVTPVESGALEPLTPDASSLDRVPHDASLREALALLLDSNQGKLVVEDQAGEPEGVLTLNGIQESLKASAA